MSELHPVVTLLLKRMDSHPEEFTSLKGNHKWVQQIEAYDLYLSEEEKKAIKEKIAHIYKDKLHEYVMDRILNGAEKDRQEEEDRKAEQQRHKANLAQAAQRITKTSPTPTPTPQEWYQNQNTWGDERNYIKLVEQEKLKMVLEMAQHQMIPFKNPYE